MLFVGSVSITNGISSNGVINIPYSSNIPNIDGQWSTATEWSDASENMIRNKFGWTLYFRAKHNQTHLFALLDFVTDQSQHWEDTGGICFDTKDDGGNYPMTDDYEFFYSGYHGRCETYQGKGTGGTYPWIDITTPPQTTAVIGFSSLNDPYESGKNHCNYEFQIPCSFLGRGYFYGFYGFVQDSNTDTLLQWPENAGGTTIEAPAPGNWGNIASSVEFIPEFPSLLILPLFMIPTLLAVIVYGKKRNR
jgi:hypothetical protein